MVEKLLEPIEEWYPPELEKSLDEHALVVYCWTCAQLLYATEKADSITYRVSMDTQGSHWESFSDEHEIYEYPDHEM